MSVLRKHTVEIIIFTILTIVYFFLRFYHLLSLPIFTDEAIYTRWAEIAKQDSAQRFISLTDGKQPLFIWLAAAMMKFFHDPLFAARSVSVFGGFATMVGLFFLGWEIFKNRWIGLVSAGLYIVFPFGLVYDRMALYDTLVGTFTVWGLYVSILMVRRIRLDIALILGLVVGIGMLNKTNAEGALYLLPCNLLLFDWRKKQKTNRLFHWLVYALLAATLALAYYSILRLSPLFYMIALKNTTFLYPFKEWIHHPFTFFLGNFYGLWDWFVTYTTIPVIVCMIAAFFISNAYFREKILLVLWFIIPFLYAALFGKVLYPRYILFMALPLLPLAAFTLVGLFARIKNRYIIAVLYVIFIALWIRADFYILNDFARAPLPQSDLNQYINDWPAGGGVKEAVSFFQQQAQNQKIFVGTEGTFGLLPYGLEIYLVNNANITIKGYWPIHATPPSDLIAISKKVPTYVIFYQPCPDCQSIGSAPNEWPLTLIAKYKKGISNEYLSIYRVNK